MFEPVRGGTRGGQAEFKWADVSADKDRENYLGHSINAPTGRWQKNKDIHWYNREVKQTQAQRDEEIRKIKEQEAEALSEALYVRTPLHDHFVSSNLYSRT
ncbi:kinase phosphorylation protein-domain-containing protein [Sparassis latifolia]